MLGGISSCLGMIIYDTSKKENNAVYGYYEDDKIVITEGVYKELKTLQEQREEKYLKRNYLEKILYRLVLLLIILCTIVFFACSLHLFLCILFFSVTSFFPLLVLCYANVNRYVNDTDYHQMKRYHACEHAIVRCLDKGKECSIEALKQTSIYDNECGTVYSGTCILALIYITYMLINSVPFFTMLKNISMISILLFINLFNPCNPLKLFQYRAVEKPTDKEYLLGIEMIKKIQELL